MAEAMTEFAVMQQERLNTGTAWTKNEQFDKDGILL